MTKDGSIGVKLENDTGFSTRAKSTNTIDPTSDKVGAKKASPLNSLDGGEKEKEKEKSKLIAINNNNNKAAASAETQSTAKSVEKVDEPAKKLGITPRLKKPSSESAPLLPFDEKFGNRWFIEGIIGKGGYGEIYLAIDMRRVQQVAVKAEPKARKGRTAKRMILEQEVLIKMQGKPHVPKVFASGHTETLNFIVFQLLSINLGDIRRMSPTRKLSKSSVGRITVQAIAALRDLHDIGYLHRDVKPGNMCFGISERNRHVLMLIDFGLVRRFKDPDGEWRAPRQKAGFRGTQRYVSPRVHYRLEQVPCDDLTSLMYTSTELLCGELPWRNLERSEDILRVKEEILTGRLEIFGYRPVISELADFIKLVSGLDPAVDVPYAAVQQSVKKLYHPKKLSDLYDWEDEFKEAIVEKTISTDDNNSV